jgi:polyisoprenoid-binding protein YceI
MEKNMKTRTSVISSIAALAIAATLNTQAADFTVDATHSDVGFKVAHLAISKVSGQFTEIEGSLTLTPGKPETLTLKGTVQTASIDTRNEKRDAHLRNADFFDTEDHPTITFDSTSTKSLGGNKVAVTGDLTIKGVTKSTTLTGSVSKVIKDPWGNTKVGVSLSGSIDRSTYGLTWNKALETGGLMVGNKIALSIEIEAAMKK